MGETVTVLSFPEFTSGKLDSLSWYDLGADSRLQITDCPGLPAPMERDLSTLSDQDFLSQVQVLSALFLNGSLTPDHSTLRTLAFQTSQVMSRELTGTGNRALRMWAQRLNYALQPLICAAEPPADLAALVSETVLPGTKPWDALQRDNELIWISSDPTNLHIQNADARTSLTLDLPTQIDVLSDGSLSIGSLYAPGCTILHPDGRSERVRHDAPVLLVFDWAGGRFMLDKNACVTELASRRIVSRAPCRQVHFARFFDGVLYLLNNGDFGHVTLLHMADGQSVRQPTLPVQVCNDILVTDASIYMIDKQQGHVFAFDRDWRFRARELSFGNGRGQLSDPVSLRRSSSGMSCVSWLSGKYTELTLF